MTLASESGHWYTPDGDPCYEVEKKGGGLRPTTLRDARKLGLYPSVTGIMKEMSTPQLELWKIKQAVTASRTIRKRKGETDDQFALRAHRKAQEFVSARADDGGNIHAAVERYFLGEQYDPAYHQHVNGVIAELTRIGLADEVFEPEKSFGHQGYGGKCDLHNQSYVIDLKTKEALDPDSAPGLYDNHFMQLAAYREGLCVPRAEGIIIFVSSTQPGLVHAVRCREEDMIRGGRMFNALLLLWQAKRGYYPNA